MSIINEQYEVEHIYLQKNAKYPGSPYPVLLYRSVFKLSGFFTCIKIRRHLKRNGWSNFWKDGIFVYNHYHSNTHELLALVKGGTRLQLGGDQGVTVPVKAGDAILVPAGVAHKNLDNEYAVTCIGAYPGGADFDICYGHADERPLTDVNVSNVLIPVRDPVFGKVGELHYYWAEK